MPQIRREAVPAAPVQPRDGPAPPGRHSWAARYGQGILRDGIATLPRALYLHQGSLDLSAQEIWFVSYILAHKWNADLPYPSLKEMALCTGVDLSWLKRLRHKLQDKGYLQIQARQDSRGGQAPNSYDFAGLFAALEDRLAADPPLPNPIQDARPAEPPADGGAADPSFVARFGRTIARLGVAAVPQGLFRHQAALGLTPQQLWFICYILAYQWDAGLPYPSLKRMALRTGYSEPQLHTIKGSLVARGYLELVHRYSAGKGQDTNGYNFSGLLDALSGYLPAEPSAPAAAPPPEPERSGPGRRGRHRRPAAAPILAAAQGGAASLEGGEGEELSGVGGRLVKPGGGPLVQREGASTVQREGGPLVQREGASPVQRGGAPAFVTGGAAGEAGGGAAGEAEEESDHEEPDQPESNRPWPPASHPAPMDPPPYSPYIAAIMLDFSRALGDPIHGPANVTHALRLWQQSGQPEQVFVEHYLYAAQNRTRRAQGAQGAGFIANKMAYFFQTLRDLVVHPPGG